MQDEQITSDNEELLDIVINNQDNVPHDEDEDVMMFPGSGVQATHPDEVFIDLTEGADNDEEIPCEIIEDDDIIISMGPELVPAMPFQVMDLDVPEQIYWESILARIEHCTNSTELIEVVNDIQKTMKPIRKRNMDVFFNSACDMIDETALDSTPSDTPSNVVPVVTQGDRNYMCHSFSKAYSGSSGMQVEIRCRIVVEGIVHNDIYLSPSCLNRGASLIHAEESLPVIYMKYSDYRMDRRSQMTLWTICTREKYTNVHI